MMIPACKSILSEGRTEHVFSLSKGFLELFLNQTTARFYIDWLASLMWMVTAGHEQMGAVEVYAQDVSWTSFKWLKGLTFKHAQTGDFAGRAGTLTHMKHSQMAYWG